MLADSGMKHLSTHAPPRSRAATSSPANAFSTTPRSATTLPSSPPAGSSGLSEAEQKIYDLVVRRFMAVFFPSAEYMVTTRISQAVGHSFKTEGKVLVKPAGWPFTARKRRREQGRRRQEPVNLVPVKPGEMVRAEVVEPKGLKTRPPARYSEATAAGRHGRRRQAGGRRRASRSHAGKRPGTPATRSSIIEGLIAEKYMLREAAS